MTILLCNNFYKAMNLFLKYPSFMLFSLLGIVALFLLLRFLTKYLPELTGIADKVGDGCWKLSTAMEVSRLVAAISVLAVFYLHYIRAQTTRSYEFNIGSQTITRLCQTKTIISVNGQFPGPQISVFEGDKLLIKVTNNAAPSISIHWHGMFQNRTGWFDGPSYVTQCPIQTGNSFTYNFTVTGQRGTLWWHAHTSTLRATVYGAFIIRPIARYPFRNLQGQIRGEKTIILGQWWNSDVLAVINEALATGRGSNMSDALTINGLPGPFYGDCSASDTASIDVQSGGTYLLRIINAAMDNDLFFGVAGHNLTVVEADASYVKPFNTSSIVISPGQTLSVLLTASTVTGSYYMAAHVYTSTARFDNSTTAATLEVGSTSGTSQSRLPVLPDFSDTPFVTDFNSKLRSLSTAGIPVPTGIDKEMVITVGLNLQDCPPGAPTNSCQGFGRGQLAASMNNISFVLPSTAILQAYYNRASSGVYSADFPAFPAEYDYTGTPLQNLNAIEGTQVHVVPYGANVQVVLQGTSLVAALVHPLHLHGYDFYVVGSGFGNYDSSLASTFNLDDPPSRNTIQVPAGGWTAIRFKADNPGVWYFHCHLDLHTAWGLDTVLIVRDGKVPSQQLQPPPDDLPKC